MHNVHLMLAMIWAFVTAGVVIWAVTDPGRDHMLLIVVSGILALYNLARWLAARKRVQPEDWTPRRRHKEEQPPDPTFDFSKDVPPENR